MASFETILCETDGPVATLTLNRPESMNGMTNRMVREAYEALSAIADDASVRVVVLTGAGRAFCPGADLRHFTSGATDERPDPRAFHAAVLLHEMPPVTIAAINGACAGAGLGWACACDLRVSARSANYSTAFLNVAVAGDMGGPWTLPRIVGAAKARELYFLPDKFGSEEALRVGLVSRVFDDEAFRDEVAALVGRLARAAPLALRTMKQNFVAAERLGFADYVSWETERHLRVSTSPDTAEAFRAFVEKREPRYS